MFNACDGSSLVRYRSIRPPNEGYRRLHVLLTREGIIMNHKKLRRLYREERLQVAGARVASGRSAPERRAKLKYLDNLKLEHALALRKEGRLQGLRGFLHQVWRSAKRFSPRACCLGTKMVN